MFFKKNQLFMFFKRKRDRSEITKIMKNRMKYARHYLKKKLFIK